MFSHTAPPTCSQHSHKTLPTSTDEEEEEEEEERTTGCFNILIPKQTCFGIRMLVVWTLFNTHPRKFRKRPHKKVSRTTRNQNQIDVDNTITELLLGYKSPGFLNKLRTYIMSLPTHFLNKLCMLADKLLIEQTMPRYIMLVIKDLAKFRLDRYQNTTDTAEKQPNDRFIQLHFSNKGMHCKKCFVTLTI